MKKGKFLLFFLMLIAFAFIPFKASAASWKFMWKNTTVHVPLGASIEDYKNVPKANLYRNEILLTDTTITYNTEGDWMYYFKDINTHKTGNYPVWYKAYDAKYSPGTCTGYKALITFVVEDKEAPRITIGNSYCYIKRGSSVDLSYNYSVKDNDKIDKVSLMHEINSNKVGTYPVTVVAIDASGNKSSKEFYTVVYENEAPVISFDMPNDILEIPLNKPCDIKSHFTATDTFEGDISSKIEYPTIKNDVVEEYSYTVCVKNDANLSNHYTITIRVVDDVEPKLELTTKSLLFDYMIDLNSIDFMDYIKDLSDNKEINYDNLKITTDMENKVGSYTIWYSYTDDIYTVSDSIAVSLISYTKPEIIVEDISILEDSDVDLSLFIECYDESDENILDSLEIYDQNVDYGKPGTYYAEAYCMNSSGLSTTKTFKVIVNSNGIEINPMLIGMIISLAISICLIAFILIYILLKKRKHKTE